MRNNHDGQARIAIVGCGPNGLYFLNQLLSLKQLRPDLEFSITIFDKYGSFGSGWAHSPHQPQTSMLNRIVGQLSYAPDASNGISIETPGKHNVTFSEWCERKHRETGDDKYKNTPQEFPTRRLYGESLVDVFASTKEALEKLGCVVTLAIQEVVGIVKAGRSDYTIATAASGKRFPANIVILATGHQELKREGVGTSYTSLLEYYNYAYPLFDIPAWEEKEIGIMGMGLTAIDFILYYTENKGGTFSRKDGSLEYSRSGREPKKLFALSRSGYFTYSRPINDKEVDLLRYEHAGYFFTKANIDKMRRHIGYPAHEENSPYNHQIQLDFERNLFPMLILETNLCYYRLLYGPEILNVMLRRTAPLVEDFCLRHSEHNQLKEAAIKYLTSQVDEIARETTFKVRMYLSHRTNSTAAGIPCDIPARRFVEVVYGTQLAQCDDIAKIFFDLQDTPSPWAHSRHPEDHLFNWDYIVDPIKYIDHDGGQSYKDRLLNFMRIDRLQSEQGNLQNPYKGACDDVFRDLRQTVVYAIDFGGITPASYAWMLKNFYAVHNRAANGNCIELMEKIEALIAAEILDVSFARVNIQVLGEDVYLHSISDPGKVAQPDVLVDGKLHEFSVNRAINPLFRKMISDGIASYWIHKDGLGVTNELSGFNLTPGFQIINSDGELEGIFCLGQPSEGPMFFQNGSIRPNVDHHVANDLLTCFKSFRETLDALLSEVA